MRCPTLVGRRAELAALRSAVASARIGRGSTAALVGPPGIGKSRLVREAGAAARSWGLPVLVGRAVQAGDGTAFRPLTEALLAGLRRVPEPDAPALAPHRSVLGRLLPQWRTGPGGRDDSQAVLGEAVLRLLSALAGDGGLVLVLEDLHWADPDTLGVLEYLADNVAEERILVLVTARDDDCPASGVVRALAVRHACVALPLGPLDPAEVDAMAAACTGAAAPTDVPAEVRAALHRRAGGTPLLVEELLAAGVDPAVVVPATVTELVAGRLATLPARARRCVEVAAVLGARFDWELLAATLDEAVPDVLDSLRAATRVGVLDAGDGLRFHHALGRDAVLAAMLPPERSTWARRALVALAATRPELDGDWCDLAADLALRAGDTARATTVLVEAGRRNLDRGALASAEAVLRRAHHLAATDPALTAGVDDVLADVLAVAGKTTDAVAVGRRCVERLRSHRGPDAVAARLRLARIHATAGDWLAALEQLDAARGAGPDDDQAFRIDAAAAEVALADGRFDDATALAEGVLERSGSPSAHVDVLIVLGRIARRDDPGVAEELLERARAVAEDASLPVAAARAAHELAISDVQISLRLDRLGAARDRAESLGDLAAVAVLDLQLTATHNARWEPVPALRAAQRCVAASRRFRLATLPKALVLGAAARTGPGDAAEADLTEALALAPDDTHLLGEVRGVRAYRALDVADDARAADHLAGAMEAFARRPNEVSGSPAVGLSILLRTAREPGLADPPQPREPLGARWNHGLSGFADAVALGRRGDGDAALAAFADADALLRRPVDIGWHRLQGRRIVAGAALADGWGEPARWLAEDLPQLESRGLERWAAAVRGLWRRTGSVVPRPAGDVPPALRALGITRREIEVLALVADGHGNREIAQRLHLSPRTVEKHVEHLLAKSGMARRPELIVWGRGPIGSSRTATGAEPGGLRSPTCGQAGCSGC